MEFSDGKMLAGAWMKEEDGMMGEKKESNSETCIWIWHLWWTTSKLIKKKVAWDWVAVTFSLFFLWGPNIHWIPDRNMLNWFLLCTFSPETVNLVSLVTSEDGRVINLEENLMRPNRMFAIVVNKFKFHHFWLKTKQFNDETNAVFNW